MNRERLLCRHLKCFTSVSFEIESQFHIPSEYFTDAQKRDVFKIPVSNLRDIYKHVYRYTWQDCARGGSTKCINLLARSGLVHRIHLPLSRYKLRALAISSACSMLLQSQHLYANKLLVPSPSTSFLTLIAYSFYFWKLI